MFADRIKHLRQSKELNQVQLAEKLGVKKQSVSNWENDNIMPSVDMLVKIADFFDVSTDYLLGRKEDSHVRSFHACPPFGERLIFLLQENHCSQYKLCKDANISSSVLRHWLNGTHVPSLDNVVKLADFFGCSADYVLGREK